MKPSISSQRGLTLIELMVVIALIGVMAAIAAPSFRLILVNNKVQTASAEFQAALALARAEAIKRGSDARVTVVANALTTGTPPKADWAQGVTVFYDTSTDAHGKAPPSTTTDVLLKTSALDSSVKVDSNIDSISYNGMGRPFSSTGGVGNGTVAFGASAGDTDWRCTIISTVGRMRSARVVAADYSALSSCPTS